MCQINEVVDVALTISHRGLISSEAPVPVHYKLILMLSPLQLHIAKELIPSTLSHADPVKPLAERADQEYFVTALTPGENIVH
jgi:hypothetical protein